jgi:hypothetical protein
MERQGLRIAPPPLGLTSHFLLGNWSVTWCIAGLAGDVVVPGSQVGADIFRQGRIYE